MDRKRIEIPENLFPILFHAYNRSMRITNIDLGLTQIHTDVKQFSSDCTAINKLKIHDMWSIIPHMRATFSRFKNLSKKSALQTSFIY